MFFDDYGVGDGEALTRSLAYLLSGKKGVEDFVSMGLGNPAASVGNADLGKSILNACLDRDKALNAGILADYVDDGVDRIDQ